MDNHEAQEWLAAYRPDGRDALDPNFSRALAQAERDPDLKAWFADQRAFDTTATRALASIPVPTDGKDRLLAELSAVQSAPRRILRFPRRLAVLTLAAAACLTAIVVVRSPDTTGSPLVRQESFSLSALTRSLDRLDLKSADPIEIRDYLTSRAAPQPAVLSGQLTTGGMVGCKIYRTENGGQISLICLRVNEEIVHVFTFDHRSREFLDAPVNTWWREGPWNMRAFPGEDQLVVVVTRLDPAKLGITSAPSGSDPAMIIDTNCPPPESPIPPGPFA